MSTNAKPGIGAKLNYWSTSGTTGAWVQLTEVTNLQGSGLSREVIEIFNLENADDYKDKLQGILDGGDITASINYTQQQFKELKSQAETRGLRMYQVVLPDGEGIEWDGFIRELPLDIGSGDAMKSEVVFAVSGKPDFVTVASP